MDFAAARLVEQRGELARTWADALAASGRAPALAPEAVDAMAALLEHASAFLRTGETRVLTDEPSALASLGELARLWRGGDGDARGLVHAFDRLADVLADACARWLRGFGGRMPREAVVRTVARLDRAPLLMAGVTLDAYWRAERAADGAGLGRFADALAHELGTPLAAAESAACVLEGDDILDDRQSRRRFAGLVQRNLHRARTLISDVRALALAGSVEAHGPRLLPMDRLLAEVVSHVRDPVQAAGARLLVADPPPDLCADAARLEMVLVNLIVNAAKYSDPLRRVRWIRLDFGRAADPADGWWIEVSDNGLGIAPEHQSRVFQRFYRAHPERSDGSGLGLSIVHDAVRQLGGAVEVRSQPGLGTTFRVSLPYSSPDAEV